MRKIFSILLCLTLFSCGSNNKNREVKLTTDYLIGLWEATDVGILKEDESLKWNDCSEIADKTSLSFHSMDFRNDKAMIRQAGFKAEIGFYSIEDRDIYYHIKDSEIISTILFIVEELEQNKMVIKMVKLDDSDLTSFEMYYKMKRVR